MKKLKNKKIVIWTANGLGDITMSFPLLNYFKRKGAHITLIGIHKNYLKFLKHWGMIDNYITFKYKENQSKVFWAKERFKIMFDVGMLRADTMIVLSKNSFFNNIRYKSFFAVENYFFIENGTCYNQCDLNNKILKEHYSYDVKEEDYYFCKELKDSFDKFKTSKDYIAINPFSKKPDTIIKPKYFYSLLDRKENYCLIGSLDNDIKDYKKKNISNTLSNDFYRSLFILYHAKYLITGDSGVMHFNLALRKKTVSYWKEARPRPEEVIRKINLSEEHIVKDSNFEVVQKV